MQKIVKKSLVSLMLTTIIFLTTLIVFKSNKASKEWFINNILNKTFSFAFINEKYEYLFGSSIPFKDLVPTTEPVFSEKLVYSNKVKYEDGVSLTVADNYLVPSLEKGLVIFVGEKEKYGLCVIVQQVDAVEAMYCSLDSVAVKLYDYIDSGMLIGEVNDHNLILIFKDNNGILNYEKYI